MQNAGNDKLARWDQPANSLDGLNLMKHLADENGVAAIEALMRELCLGPGPERTGRELGRIAWEHISTGGKRLRARLAMSTVEALGGNTSDGVAWGAACEFLHNASLIHDDIEDGDTFRRGKAALWTRYGIAQAINAGDLCIALGYAAIESVPGSSSLRWELTQCVTRAARRIVEGQAAEFLLLDGKIPSFGEYASCVEGKTSALFSLPIEGAALIANRTAAETSLLVDSCRSLGLLFQIQDDILDLYGENGRDLRGSDLAQAGKASVFVVEHLRMHPQDHKWLIGILNAPRKTTPQATIDEVIERFRSLGTLRAVWERIEAIRGELHRSSSLRGEPVLASLIDAFVMAALKPVTHTRPADL